MCRLRRCFHCCCVCFGPFCFVIRFLGRDFRLLRCQLPSLLVMSLLFFIFVAVVVMVVVFSVASIVPLSSLVMSLLFFSFVVVIMVVVFSVTSIVLLSSLVMSLSSCLSYLVLSLFLFVRRCCCYSCRGLLCYFHRCFVRRCRLCRCGRPHCCCHYLLTTLLLTITIPEALQSTMDKALADVQEMIKEMGAILRPHVCSQHNCSRFCCFCCRRCC